MIGRLLPDDAVSVEACGIDGRGVLPGERSLVASESERRRRTSRLAAYLELVRPPNLASAAADALAGIAIAGQALAWRAWWLVAASVLLYAGGVVLNDVFDAARDAVERPERAIPSGRASGPTAARLGVALLAAGCAVTFAVGPLSGLLAVAIAAAAVLYDGVTKDHPLLGPVNMGSCRALNLALGISASPAVLAQRWPLALIPLVLVAGITTLSRGEVAGGGRAAAAVALLLLAVAETALAVVAVADHGSPVGILLVAVLVLWTLVPVAAAWQRPTPQRIRRGVIAGVTGLVLLDAALAASFAVPAAALLPLAMLPLGLLMARAFAVT